VAVNGQLPSSCAALSAAQPPLSLLAVGAPGAAAPAAAAAAAAAHDACGAAANGSALTLLRHGPLFRGADTSARNYAGCAAGAGVSLWATRGLGAAVSDTSFAPRFAAAALQWLFAHPSGGASPPPPAPPAPRARATAPPRPARAGALSGPAEGAPAPRAAPVKRSPPPPQPPSLLARLRAAAELRRGLAKAPAPAPARHARAPGPAAVAAMRASAPAPAPSADVTSLAGPDQTEPPASPPPQQPAPAPAPALPQEGQAMTAGQLMALLSNPDALQSLIGGGLASNTALPANVKALLGEPAVQAVLRAAAASPDPGQFLSNALSVRGAAAARSLALTRAQAAGIDINALLGEVAPAPAPAPVVSAMAGEEGQKSGTAGARSAVAALAAVAALLLF